VFFALPNQHINRTEGSFPRAIKYQNSFEILVTVLSLQMLILPEPSPKKSYFLAEYFNFQKNIGPISEDMQAKPPWWLMIVQ
jgi:hypothetical protein